jgi:hypothetical protein
MSLARKESGHIAAQLRQCAIVVARPLVRAVGIEPTLSYEKRILSPLRLPFRHARRVVALYSSGPVRTRKRRPDDVVRPALDQYTLTTVRVSRSTRTRLSFSIT